MRVLCTSLLGLVIVCLAGGVAVSTDLEKADPASSSGLVYGYGVKLTPPYEFTKSEDRKTLYLNGMVYAGPGDKEPSDIEVTEEARAAHELNVRAGEEAKKGTTYADRLARMAAVYRSSPLVESVRRDSHRVYVKWVAYQHEMGFGLMERLLDERSEFDRNTFWEKLKSSFWHTVDSGGMVVFGEKYHIFCPESSVPKTLEQIEHVGAGRPRDQLDVIETPLRNQRFLDDLYRRREGSKDE